MDFPDWGDPGAPAAQRVSPHYIEHALEETAVPNLVTAILADYRGFDTLFETIVIFTAGMVCLFLLKSQKPAARSSRLFRHIPTGITFRVEKGGKLPRESDQFELIDTTWVPHDLVIRTTCRLLIPFIQVFALYVIAHGHHSPGGGFQGGVILGAAVVLFAIGFNLRSAQARMSEHHAAVGCALGVLIFTGTGLACLIAGGSFLDYSALAALLGTDPVHARSHSILVVEIGVGMAVMAVMVLLYYILASAGQHEEGL